MVLKSNQINKANNTITLTSTTTKIQNPNFLLILKAKHLIRQTTHERDPHKAIQCTKCDVEDMRRP